MQAALLYQGCLWCGADQVNGVSQQQSLVIGLRHCPVIATEHSAGGQRQSPAAVQQRQSLDTHSLNAVTGLGNYTSWFSFFDWFPSAVINRLFVFCNEIDCNWLSVQNIQWWTVGLRTTFDSFTLPVQFTYTRGLQISEWNVAKSSGKCFCMCRQVLSTLPSFVYSISLDSSCTLFCCTCTDTLLLSVCCSLSCIYWRCEMKQKLMPVELVSLNVRGSFHMWVTKRHHSVDVHHMRNPKYVFCKEYYSEYQIWVLFWWRHCDVIYRH